jgi:hypothetical protein
MDNFLEQRVKQLEESVSWMQRDINHLIDIIEHLQPEQHTHYTTIIYTKQLPFCDDTGYNEDCDEKGFED